MVKILLDFNRLNDGDFNIRLASHFKKMNNNATYAMFQSLITALGVIANDYDTALTNAEERGKTVIKIKNKLKADAQMFLTKLAAKIETVANDMPEEEGTTFAKGTSFTVKEATTKTALTFLEVPTNFSVEDDKNRKGWCTASWDKSAGAVSYVLEEWDAKGTIINTFTSTKTTLNISGTESKVVRNFSVRATGTGSLRSDNTDTVSVFVS